MKKNFIGLFFIFMFMGIAPLNALAKSLELKNNNSFPIDVAACFEDPKKGWVAMGWWTVKARSERTIVINAQSRNVYIYGKNDGQGKEWSGEKNNKNDRSFYILPSKFEHACSATPSGRNREQVRFQHIDFEDYDAVSYTFDNN